MSNADSVSKKIFLFSSGDLDSFRVPETTLCEQHQAMQTLVKEPWPMAIKTPQLLSHEQ